MKTIPNVQTNLPAAKPGENPPCFSDLLLKALDFSAQGFTPELMRKRARVEKSIAGVIPGGDMVFEDADYETAQEAVRTVVWMGRHPAYIALADAFGV